MKSRMASRRATVKKAQTGKIKKYQNAPGPVKKSASVSDTTNYLADPFKAKKTIYERTVPGVRTYSQPDLQNPYAGRGMARDSAAFEMHPDVRASRQSLARLKGMSSEAFEAMARRERAQEEKEEARLKNKQRGGGKTAKKSATASRMKAKTGKKVVARKAVATKKAKTGARSYKRK